MRCSNRIRFIPGQGSGGIQNNDSSSQQTFACFHKHSSHIRPLARQKWQLWQNLFSLSITLSTWQLLHFFFLPNQFFHCKSPTSLSLSLSGGEQDLISSCRIKRRPLYAGSRWWKIRLFGPASSWMQRACLSAREHQITLNPGSLTPLILNGRLI